MQKSLLDVFRLLLPLGPNARHKLKQIAPYVSKREVGDARYLARLRRVGFHEEQYTTAKCPDANWVQLTPSVSDTELVGFVTALNRKIADAVKVETFRSFRKDALEVITDLIAPNIFGLDTAKKAAALQLFARESFHTLLLGDPGTGKTDVLRSIERLAPLARFGLGSGASKAGLVGMYEGKSFLPGVLVQADEGIALLDELNLMKKEERAGLYSAMEKGFVTYDKGGRHEKHDARVRVLATANPKADKFVGKDVKFLRTQLPFSSALLTRFHLVFLIMRPSTRELGQITSHMVKGDVRELEDGDARFVQEYVTYAEKLEVQFDDRYEKEIVAFIEGLKKREEEFLVEVGPRTVLGVIRMAKSFARARLARHVSKADLENAMQMMEQSLVLVK